jgi:demethylmenaquinone methyltransferase/2-methoxy-6-polyprenyl-1,4-benzoquinol methylase
MFDRIAERYDLLNRVISLGVDQRWRRATVAALEPAVSPEGAEFLDLATGTGDLALAVAQRYPQCSVIGVDPSLQMMQVGERKRTQAPWHGKAGQRVRFVQGDAQRLEFDADRFAGVSMAFGIRNVPDRSAALREIARVTRPGGRIAILELSEPKRGPLAAVARFHMHRLVPWLGALLSGEREYRYLPQSIAAFPAPEAFAEQLQQAGLRVLQVQKFTFGVCHLYVAEVP